MINGKIRGKIEKNFKQRFKRKCCSAKGLFGIECSNKIIESHTISKSSSLKSIMNKDNKVYGLDLSFHGLTKNNGFLSIKEFGINEASTFLGFCSNHDKELFSIFEDKPFIPTKEQLCLLSFRSLCREIYGKTGESQTKLLHELAVDPIELEMLSYRDHLLAISKHELGITLSDMIKIIEQKKFDKLEYFIIELNSNAQILVSGGFVPERDFNNQPVCDLLDETKILNYIFFNVVNYKGKGFCIFSWIKKPETEIFKRFVKTLTQRKHRIADNLVNFIFYHFENTFFSIDWWNKLEQAKQFEIKGRLVNFGFTKFSAHRVKNYRAFDIDKFYFVE
ncbi:cytoplasmic protein [Actinobacillus equuli]|uniref:cytoplasmic protein n=1 Tax=Actinobacillus equuli TaxID=718 RepID=UPI00244132FE|nr:cytoplasmic protein [Actinobacillus equuli]WGE57159.1 cytoplasmic protein [Actinobacillus equuli subsp. equuli]